MKKNILFGFIIALFAFQAQAQVPVNDLCLDAIPLICGDVVFGNTEMSTITSSPEDGCGTTNGAPGNWYSFAGNGDIVDFSLCSVTDYDTKIRVYSGNCFALTCVGGNDDSCGLQSEFTFMTDASTNYLIYVFGFGTAVGDYELTVTCTSIPLPPLNDECDLQAVPALVNSDDQCTLLNPGALGGATASPQVNDCVGNAGDDVWFSFVATSEIHTIELLNVAGGLTNLVHAIYEGPDCDNLTEITCSDPDDSFNLGLIIGETYFVRVWTFGDDLLNLTTFDLCIASFTPPPPPVNDECLGALNVDVNLDDSCALFTSGQLLGATETTVTSTCPGSGDDDVWFSFTATNTAHQVSLLNIVGDVTNLVHGVYSGPDCDNLTELYCSNPDISQSSDFIIGEMYWIRVFSFSAIPFQDVAFDVCVNTFDTIVVNSPNDTETSLNAEELVEDVFVEQGGCGNVDITFTNLQENPSGVNDITERSWGYFKRGSTGFPLEDGIVLSSGFAESAEGPNNAAGVSDGNGAWQGDIDLETILNNQLGSTVNTFNATVFEFEFTSNIPLVTFDFVFASEEYENQFECTDIFRDGFAFLVSGPGIPDTSGAPFGGVNIASVQGSNDVPVSTLSIHRDTFTCGPEVLGVDFFPDLYVSNSADNLNVQPTQYDGITAILTTATVPVQLGEVYTVKLVIGDRGDSAFDSAVFLAGGSFDLGQIDIGDDLTIASGNAGCEGEAVLLDTGLNDDGIFVWTMDGTELSTETGSTLAVTTSGEYSVTVTFPNTTCTLQDTIIVEFFSSPIVDLGADVTFCPGDNAVLIGTPTNATDLTNISYQWSRDMVELPGEINAIISPDQDGTYSVVVTSAGGCTGTDSVEVNIVTFTVLLESDQEFCGFEPFEIVPVIDGEDATNATYVWSTGEITPTITVATSDTYSVTVTIMGCDVTSNNITLTFRDIPVVDLGEDLPLCGGTTITLDGTPDNEADLDNITYQWFLDGVALAGETDAMLDADQGGLYSVVVTSEGGCTGTDDILLNLVDFTVIIGEDQQLCGIDSLTLIPDVIGEDATNATYVWSTGETTPTITVTEDGGYTVEVTFMGCTVVSNQITLNFRSLPEIAINGGEDIFTKCTFDTETLVATATNQDGSPVTFRWFLDGGLLEGETGSTLDIIDGGVYEVEVSNDGCLSSDDIFVDFFANENCIITQGISPNGDGFNDNLDLEFLNERIGIEKVSIFNRFGTVVFELDNYVNEWFGQTDDGDELPVGNYYYVINLADGDAETGFIYLNK